jgi:hypothetical protein
VKSLSLAFLLMFLQMSGTIMPLFLFPHETWVRFPFAATLEGQYIIKNVVLVSAGVVIYAALRQGEPAVDRTAERERRELSLVASSRDELAPSDMVGESPVAP